jgi:hypothetical protein
MQAPEVWSYLISIFDPKLTRDTFAVLSPSTRVELLRLRSKLCKLDTADPNNDDMLFKMPQYPACLSVPIQVP